MKKLLSCLALCLLCATAFALVPQFPLNDQPNFTGKFYKDPADGTIWKVVAEDKDTIWIGPFDDGKAVTQDNYYDESAAD